MATVSVVRAATFTLAGVQLTDLDLQSAVSAIRQHALARTSVGVHLCNAYTLSEASRNSHYRDELNHRALNLPDGTPVAWFRRVTAGGHKRTPVRGPSLMRALLDQPNLRHFLLGGTPDVLSDLEVAIKSDHPEATVVGTLAPPFRDPTDEDVRSYAKAIRESGAQIVWIGLGTPRQDALIARLVEHSDAVLIGIGAAFDFLSGRKPEAPEALHGSGLEWLHRFRAEPHRLWKRYLFGNARFLVRAARDVPAARRAAHGG